MTEKAKKYLSDIDISIGLIEKFMEGIDEFSQYESDEKTKGAIERQLGIVGEAVNKFRKEEQDFQLSHTKQIIDFRNRLIHSYDNIDDTIIWAIITNHLPVLKAEARKALKL